MGGQANIIPLIFILSMHAHLTVGVWPFAIILGAVPYSKMPVGQGQEISKIMS